ncbi:hypothetical protein ACA910_014047 [Epithemia clementina (nom. ined.)]
MTTIVSTVTASTTIRNLLPSSSTTTITTCPAGLYASVSVGHGKETDSFSCQPVGTGFYSPKDDTNRYPCAAGTFSSSETAEACEACPAGMYAATAGSAACTYCNVASFSSFSASVECVPCNPYYYGGLGSDFAMQLLFMEEPDEDVGGGGDDVVVTNESSGGNDDWYCLEPLSGAVPVADEQDTTTPTSTTPSPTTTTTTTTTIATAAPTTTMTMVPHPTESPTTAGTIPQDGPSDSSVDNESKNTNDSDDNDKNGSVKFSIWIMIVVAILLVAAFVWRMAMVCARNKRSQQSSHKPTKMQTQTFPRRKQGRFAWSPAVTNKTSSTKSMALAAAINRATQKQRQEAHDKEASHDETGARRGEGDGTLRMETDASTCTGMSSSGNSSGGGTNTTTDEASGSVSSSIWWEWMRPNITADDDDDQMNQNDVCKNKNQINSKNVLLLDEDEEEFPEPTWPGEDEEDGFSVSTDFPLHTINKHKQQDKKHNKEDGIFAPCAVVATKDEEDDVSTLLSFNNNANSSNNKQNSIIPSPQNIADIDDECYFSTVL